MCVAIHLYRTALRENSTRALSTWPASEHPLALRAVTRTDNRVIDVVVTSGPLHKCVPDKGVQFNVRESEYRDAPGVAVYVIIRGSCSPTSSVG